MKKFLFLYLLLIVFLHANSQSDHWALVMSDNGNYEQFWKTTSYFPEKEINDYWAKNYRISSLTYGSGNWALVMSNSGSYAEAWRTNVDFPEKEIQEFWDKSYRIKSLSHGAGKWALVMSVLGDYPQVWRTNSVFPEKEIQEFLDKGYRIHSLNYGAGKWALVMNKEAQYDQIWRVRPYFPEDDINEYWAKNYRITSLTYGNGNWALVMSKLNDYPQAWRVNKNFPVSEINEFTAKNFKITGLSYGSYTKKSIENEAPLITITEPDLTRGYSLVEATSVKISGNANDPDGILNVLVNGKEATLESNGNFFVYIQLTEGKNPITVTATDKKMKSALKAFELNHKTAAVINDFSKQKRVALVCGNSGYTGVADLGTNPLNDAKDMASALKSLGFDVITKIDADLATMNSAIREFGRLNSDADVALFFFAGHGMQIENENYLLPIGVKLNDKADVGFECVSVNTVQKIMETSNAGRLNIMILDACRNNPFRTWERGGAAGLSDMTPPSGTLIAFATSPGSTASNGDGRNGLYTGELIKQLKISQRIEDVFINTRIEVEKKSGGQQSPWELARLRGIYYLKN